MAESIFGRPISATSAGRENAGVAESFDDSSRTSTSRRFNLTSATDAPVYGAMSAGTHHSATVLATSTAAPKFVLFTDTVVFGNLAPVGSFTW